MIPFYNKHRYFHRFLHQFNYFSHLRLPFDWKNPSGYLIAVCIEGIVSLPVLHYFAFIVSFGLGGYFFAIASVKDMKADMQSVNEAAKIKQSDCLKHINEFAHLHANTIRLSIHSENSIKTFTKLIIFRLSDFATILQV